MSFVHCPMIEVLSKTPKSLLHLLSNSSPKPMVIRILIIRAVFIGNYQLCGCRHSVFNFKTYVAGTSLLVQWLRL